MAITTGIEWCDSTLNLQMGCDGCELWNPKAGIKRCYAGTLTERYAGKNPGFPTSFEEPKLFLERLDAALKWPDLTGKPRPDKPWLDGLPRIIFPDDMGDTFTESLPLDWLAPLLPRIAESPHQFLLLTKRSRRLLNFAQQYPLPPNVWPGVSVTGGSKFGRLIDLQHIKSGGPKWVSLEPLWEMVSVRDSFPRIRWVIVGGESGKHDDCKPMHPDWVRRVRDECLTAGVPFFFKQWGEWIPRSHLEPSYRVSAHSWGTIANDGTFYPVTTPWNGRDDYGIEDDDGNENEAIMVRVGKKKAGAMLDGRVWREMPNLPNLEVAT